MLFNRDGTPIDTLKFSAGLASDSRNGRTVFNGTNTYTYERHLYIYDHTSNSAIDSLPPPGAFGLTPYFLTSKWLNDEEIVLAASSMIAIADFTNQNYRIIKEFPIDCDNQRIESVAVVPNRPNEILYTLQYYFYNEAGEYRKRHDLVHLDISTGEERVLVVE
jgi:hypothetical protein